MPIDPMISDSMLGTFRNMAQDCKDKGLNGEDFDKMLETLARMEELVQIHDDLNAFNGQLVQENLFAKFSDHYGRVLGAGAQGSAESGDEYDDKALLNQTLDALRNAVKSIKEAKQNAIDQSAVYDPEKAIDQGLDYVERNKEKLGLKREIDEIGGGIENVRKEARDDLKNEIAAKPKAYDNTAEIEALINTEALVKPIEDIISLGEQEGMTFPRFLRLQIEKGLDKAMEGSVVVREGYEYDHQWAKANSRNPHIIEKTVKKLELFDKLASASPFNVPNSDELNIGELRIDHEYEPKIIKWDEICRRWDQLLWDLSFWSLSYTKFAPYIEPWSMSANPNREVEKTRDTTPGIFKEHCRLFEKYFGITFLEIFRHETFEWNVEYLFIDYSQEYIEFLIEVIYPECRPDNHLSSEIILSREAFYNDKKEQNPDIMKPVHKFIEFYDSKFGEGRFVSKFGPPAEVVSNAESWNFEAFRKKTIT